MKILILSFLIGSVPSVVYSQAKAQGCIDRTLNVKMALKMQGILGGLRGEQTLQGKEGEQRNLFYNDISPEKICAQVSQEQRDQFEAERDSLKRVRKHLLKEFSSKKKISADVFVALDGDTTKTELTEQEACEETDKVLRRYGSPSSCDSENFTIQNTQKLDTMNPSFEEVCKKALPVMRESYKRMQRCEENLADSKKPKPQAVTEKASETASKGYGLPGTEEASKSYVEELNKAKSKNSKSKDTSRKATGQ